MAFLTPIARKHEFSALLLGTPTGEMLLGSPLCGGFTFASPRPAGPGFALQDGCISLELLLSSDAEAERGSNGGPVDLFPEGLPDAPAAGRPASGERRRGAPALGLGVLPRGPQHTPLTSHPPSLACLQRARRP